MFTKYKIASLNQDKRGVAALMTVVVVGAAALIMAYTASILGLGELDMGYTSQKGAEAFSLSDGCAEEALRHLRLNNNYSGETLSLGAGSCIIGITSVGNDRIINITANIGNQYFQGLAVTATLSGDGSNSLTLTGWEEI